MGLKLTLKLTPLILVLLLAFTFTPAHATSSDQPEQPTITTTVENSEGTHTETKPYIEGQSTGVEYFRGASVTISLTTTASMLPLPAPHIEDWWNEIRNWIPAIMPILYNLFRLVGGWLSKIWNIRKSRKESEREKKRPQPGVEIYKISGRVS